MTISDEAWKKIEKGIGVSDTGIGARLRTYEKAHKKLEGLGALDPAKASAAAAASGVQQAKVASTELRKAQGLIMKIIKAKKVPVNTPEFKAFMAFANEVGKEQEAMDTLVRKLG